MLHEPQIEIQLTLIPQMSVWMTDTLMFCDICAGIVVFYRCVCNITINVFNSKRFISAGEEQH